MMLTQHATINRWWHTGSSLLSLKWPRRGSRRCGRGTSASTAGGCECHADNDVTCDEDLCADVVCEGADAVCEGDTLMGGYTSSCDAATGECQPSPAEPPVECEFGCVDGACLPEPGDAYDPCADKACGETCSICDPTDNDCMETAEVKGCNHSGVCQGGFDPGLCAYEPCEAGDSFPASDGCNTCFCPAEGYTMETDCTEEECG